MEDVVILVGRRDKAVVHGMTPKGGNWIKMNMTDEGPITISAEAVAEIRKMIEADGLTVIER